MRNVTTTELKAAVSSLLGSSISEDESIIFREGGEFGRAVAILLTGRDFAEFAEWRRQRAKQSADHISEAFAEMSEEEIERVADQAVQEVRHERYADRKAS